MAISAEAPQKTSNMVPSGESWFFTGMACTMLVLATVAFLPSILHPAERRAPLTVLAATHGILFFAWLVIFAIQSRLIAVHKIALHQRVGSAASLVFCVMIPLSYQTSIAMVRRGFDLSGDLRIDHDPLYELVFPLGDLLTFTLLASAAILNRHRPEIHRRLMLFANIALMPAPLAHLIGHSPRLSALPRSVIMIPITIFLIAAVAREFLRAKHVHPLTITLAVAMFLSGPIRAGVIGPSLAWHRLASWLAR